MFLAKVEAVQVEREYLDEKGRLHLEKPDFWRIHGEYLTLGDSLGTFDGASEKHYCIEKE